MTDKLDMTSPDLVSQNIEKIRILFPNCVTETANGLAIDFDMLKQELSAAIVEGNKERYRLEWPGKREAIVTANLPINKTLRPAREESVDFDNTENLYIEGDNLEVLKLLQESYLGKIKMIYIDPPYNTGKDFVYKDNFIQDTYEYQEEAGLKDEYNNRLVANPDTSGRYHSDWLSMMYPRLKLARNLLTDDGVIFISIDDNEVHNLRKISDEVFGEGNFVGKITWLKKRKGSFLSKKMISITEYCLVYGKTSNIVLFGGKPDSSESQPLIKRTNSVGTLNFPQNFVVTKLDDGKYSKGIYGEGSSSVELLNDINIENGIIISSFALKGPFIWGQDNLNKEINNGAKIIINTLNFQVRAFKSEDENSFKGLLSSINGVEISGTNEDGYEQLRDLLGAEKILDYPKPINYLRHLINSQSYFEPNSIILDFFSGSASTAHAVMQQNAIAKTSLKYIQVQLPEKTDEKSEAFKAGYETICEIGKERIRRAGNAIVENQKTLLKQKEEELQKIEDKNEILRDEEKIELLQSEINALQFSIDNLDKGFRVYKLDSSNMQDVYYTPNQLSQDLLSDLEDNIKADRTPDDLVAQIMLDWGLPLSYKIEKTTIAGKEVYKVQEDNLLCCFDEGIGEAFAKEIAPLKPLRIVFRDKSFKDDTAKENVKQLLKQLSPESEMKVI